MSAELELRWLKIDSTRGAIKRFSAFCKEDIKEQARKEDFDLDKYQDAIKLVIEKLDKSASIEGMFNVD